MHLNSVILLSLEYALSCVLLFQLNQQEKLLQLDVFGLKIELHVCDALCLATLQVALRRAYSESLRTNSVILLDS